MIYLYITSENVNETIMHNGNKYIKTNIHTFKNDVNYFDEYIITVKEEDLEFVLTLNDRKTKHIVIKNCNHKRRVISLLNAWHRFDRKIYFI